MTTFKREPQCKDEADVKRYVKKILDDHKWFWWMPAANTYGKAGVHDFLALRGGIFLSVETKFGKNKPTANQIAFGQSIIAETGFAFVVNEKRIDIFNKWMEAFDRSVAAAEKKEMPSDEDGATMIDCIRVLTQEL